MADNLRTNTRVGESTRVAQPVPSSPPFSPPDRVLLVLFDFHARLATNRTASYERQRLNVPARDRKDFKRGFGK